MTERFCNHSFAIVVLNFLYKGNYNDINNDDDVDYSARTLKILHTDSITHFHHGVY